MGVVSDATFARAVRTRDTFLIFATAIEQAVVSRYLPIHLCGTAGQAPSASSPIAFTRERIPTTLVRSEIAIVLVSASAALATKKTTVLSQSHSEQRR